MCKIIDETPNFMVVTDPNDFALFSALYRTSIDGRRWMYEALLSDDGKYTIPDTFTARSAEVLQVYLKSLGIRMETVYDDNEFIAEQDECNEVVAYEVGNTTIYCTLDEKYYLNRLHAIYKGYLKEYPNQIDDIDDMWEYIMKNLTFKKKYLTDNIRKIFSENLSQFAVTKSK